MSAGRVRRSAAPPGLAVNLRVVLLSLGLAACSSGPSPYTIAAAGPWQLTSGRNTRLGIALAAKEINDAGGINGHPLIVREADDQADGVRAAAVSQELVDDPAIAAVVGHVTSAAMVAAARIYDGRLAAVATAASAPELSGISRWAFRIIASDSVTGAAMAKFAAQTGHRRAAILYENDSHGRGLADAFRRSFPGEIVNTDPIAADGRHAEIFVSWLRQGQPDLVFVAGLEASGVALLTEAKRQGVRADFMGGAGWTPLAQHADVAEGAYVGAPFTSADRRPSAQRFVTAFKAANRGLEPDGNAALGYDATKLLAAALGAVGEDRARIRDWLAGLTSDFAGVTGPIRFLPTGDPAGGGIIMTRVRRDGMLGLADGTP